MLKTGYFLFRKAIGHPEKASISNHDYTSLLNIKQRNSIYTQIEESFYCISCAYRDLLRFISETTIDDSIFIITNYTDYHFISLEFGRKLSGFLSCVKLYQDTIPALSCKMLNLPKSDIFFKSIFSKKYDSHSEYRIMDALRNYAQHQSIPVEHSVHKSEWNDDFTQISYQVSFFLNHNDSKMKNIKSNVKNEIKTIGKINLVSMTKIYFSIICDIHKEIRNSLDKTRNDDMSLLTKNRELWTSTTNSTDFTGVLAGYLIDGILDKNFECIAIDPDVYKYANDLRLKAFSPKNSEKVKIYI